MFQKNTLDFSVFSWTRFSPPPLSSPNWPYSIGWLYYHLTAFWSWSMWYTHQPIMLSLCLLFIWTVNALGEKRTDGNTGVVLGLSKHLWFHIHSIIYEHIGSQKMGKSRDHVTATTGHNSHPHSHKKYLISGFHQFTILSFFSNVLHYTFF